MLPVNKSNFIAYIGWLANEREAGRRNVSSSSIPQYPSAVRYMRINLTSDPVPDYPFLSNVLRGYRRWEGAKLPKVDHRLGIPAGVMQQVWFDGMKENVNPRVARDAAMLVLSYSLNGLRESSVLSLQAANVTLCPDSITARLSVVNGKMASEVAPVSYARLGSFAWSMDLWRCWASLQGRHQRRFELPGEPSPWTSGRLTQAMTRCLARVGVITPAERTFTSHSCPIGSRTEQVLLGIPPEVRLSRYGWGFRSQEMDALYFNRTSTTSPASFWGFGPWTVSSAVKSVAILADQTPTSGAN